MPSIVPENGYVAGAMTMASLGPIHSVLSAPSDGTADRGGLT